MRITKLMGLAVTIVAIAVVINTLALSTGTVRNSVTISVVNTSSALIAIGLPTSSDLDLTLSSAGSYSMTIEDGVQPDSTYIFKDAIKITNNSDNDITLAYSFGTLPTGMTMVLKNSLTPFADISGISLTKGSSVDAYLEVATTSSTPTGAVNPTLTFTATKQ